MSIIQARSADIHVTSRTAPVAYVWGSAALTMFLYTAGYAAIGFGLLFLGAIWRLLRWRSFPWRPTPLDPPLAVFGAVLTASALASPYRSIALTVTPMLLLSAAVYYGSFAWLLDRVPGARMSLLKVWAIGAVPAALAGMAVMHALNAHLANEEMEKRALIPYGTGPNGLGTTLLLGSLLALGLALAPRARIWERGLWLVCSLVGLIGLLATESRASLLGWLVGAGCLGGYVMWSLLRPRARVAAVIAAAAAAGLVIAALVPRASELIQTPAVVSARKVDPNLMDRVMNTASDLVANRFRIWHTSLRMVAASPWLGTGFGTFGVAYEHWKTPEMSGEPFAFDLALNLAVETGLMGLYAAVWVAQAGVAEWRRWGRGLPPGADPSRPVIAALWVGLLVDQLADNTLFSIGMSAAVWLLLAFLAVPAHGAADDEGGPVPDRHRSRGIGPDGAVADAGG